MAKKPKTIKEYTARGLAIIGPYGNIWGQNLFSSKADAVRHLQAFWRGTDSFDPSKWKVVQASALVRADSGAKPERIDR